MLDAYRIAAYDDETARMDPVVTALGDGTTKIFDCSPLNYLTIADFISVGNLIRSKHLGAWSIAGSLVTFVTAPPADAVITFTGRTALILSAYDQDPVAGVVNPRVNLFEFFLLDNSDIHGFTHDAAPEKDGIEVLMLDTDEFNGADATWFQLARMNGDGTPGTYEAAGDPLILPPITYMGVLDGDAEEDANTFEVEDSDGLEEGMYLTFGHGTAEKEVRRIVEIDGNEITISPLEFTHPDGAIIYHSGYPICGKLTVPLNAVGNSPVNIRTTVPLLTFDSNSRF